MATADRDRWPDLSEHAILGAAAVVAGLVALNGGWLFSAALFALAAVGLAVVEYRDWSGYTDEPEVDDAPE